MLSDRDDETESAISRVHEVAVPPRCRRAQFDGTMHALNLQQSLFINLLDNRLSLRYENHQPKGGLQSQTIQIPA
jgi:hypothetical protein